MSKIDDILYAPIELDPVEKTTPELITISIPTHKTTGAGVCWHESWTCVVPITVSIHNPYAALASVTTKGTCG